MHSELDLIWGSKSTTVTKLGCKLGGFQYISSAKEMNSLQPGTRSFAQFDMDAFANVTNNNDNPYLADNYKDMERWSFNLQIYFLNKRFHDVVEISRSEQTIVQDRTIFEDARIFAPNLHDIGMMSDRDFANYTDLFDLMISLVKLPDLMIYIKSSIPTLVKHIEKRGRDFEKSIRIDYLQGLNNRYEEWIKSYKGRLIIVDGDNLEFADNPEDFRKITDLIDAELFGFFKE